MKILFIALCGFAALTPLQVAAQCVKDFVPKSAAETEIVKVENEWCDAAIERDAARLQHIFADDISWIEDSGYRDNAQVVHRYMVEVQEHVIELRDVRIRMFGRNVAVVSAHLHVRKTVDGKLTESDHTSLDVFQKRSGRWQLVVE